MNAITPPPAAFSDAIERPAKTSRGHLAINLGLLMAASASAVGLGGLWRFPDIAAEFQGQELALIYMACILFVGLPLISTDLIAGRRGSSHSAHRNRLGDRDESGRRASFLNRHSELIGCGLFVALYAVVGGWAIQILLVSAGLMPTAPLQDPELLHPLVVDARHDTLSDIRPAVFAQSDKLIACRIQLPLVTNDGEDVESETLAEIFGWFDRHFGGYTNLGRMEGSWHGKVEESLRVEVGVPEERMDDFRELVLAIGEKLEQDAIYFDAPPPSVEIIEMKQNLQLGGRGHVVAEHTLADPLRIDIR